jgi:hypothetical protein
MSGFIEERIAMRSKDLLISNLYAAFMVAQGDLANGARWVFYRLQLSAMIVASFSSGPSGAGIFTKSCRG